VPAVFRIVFVSQRGRLIAPMLAAALSAELAGMGLEGADVLAAGLDATGELDPAVGEGLSGEGIDPPAPASGCTPELLESAELVLCVGPTTLDQVFGMASVRAYELLDYLGRPAGSDPALDADQPLSPVERAGRLAGLARAVAEQVGRELESDPARPGAAARE
jgi:hypothetical protein